MTSQQPILLVEDDKVDAMTVVRAMKDIKVNNEIIQASNGEEALKVLKSLEGNVHPCLILLDLNMPKMNGIEFLNIIKEDPKLRLIPVVVLTTSKDEQDKLDSFKLGVAGYMIKPVDYLQFVEVVRTITLYWTLSELAEC